MVFAADVVRATPVVSDHLTEDIELQLELLLDGEKVAFAPDAVVEAEMPTTLEAASQTQHERWERAGSTWPAVRAPALAGGRSPVGPLGGSPTPTPPSTRSCRRSRSWWRPPWPSMP